MARQLITSKAVPGQQLDETLSERLKALGFDPGWPIYGHGDVYADLDLTKIRKALFESTYTSPHLVGLEAAFQTEDSDCAQLPMLLELVQLVYVPEGGSKPLRLTEYPHYYLRGLLYRNNHDRQLDPVQLHAYIDAYTPEDIRAVYIQAVPRPSGADAITPLQWADAPPGDLLPSNRQ